MVVQPPLVSILQMGVLGASVGATVDGWNVLVANVGGEDGCADGSVDGV